MSDEVMTIQKTQSDNTNRRVVKGEVISNKNDKTAIVVVERKVKHEKYGKYIKRTSKMHVHDPENQCNLGDIVTIQESKPFSKKKSWLLIDVVKRA